MFFCACTVFLYVFDAVPKTDSIVIELGDDIPQDISEYIYGNTLSMKLAKLEIPKITEGEPGEYHIYVRFLFKKFEYNLYVVDRKAPEALFSVENFICEKDAQYNTDYYVESVEDACKNLSYEYINIDENPYVHISEDKSSFSISQTGVFNIVLKISDSSGNYSTYSLPVVSDTPPQIFGVLDYYAAVNSNPEMLKGIYATDEIDGSVAVNYSFSQNSLKYSGDYAIEYISTDSLGLSSVAKGTLHTYEPLVIQDLVNTKRIDPFSGRVSGLINPYDSGYIEESDIEESISNIRNAVVRIHYASATSRVNGSGFIVKIDDESVIVCTNNHVTGNRENVVVSFYDGLNIEGTVVNGQAAPDIAFISVPVSEIPDYVLRDLRTIHINLGYYKSLSDKPMFDMGMYCINEDGSEWITRYGKVVRKSGKLSEFFAGYDYDVTEVSIELAPGVSGSAIVDTHGNLLCMAAFYWQHGNVKEYYGVSLDDILDFYEKTFGERLEYY